MDTAFFASEAGLHAHRDVSEREKRLAEELVQQILALARLEGFAADDRYRRLVKRAETLQAFLFQMSDAMDDFERAVHDTSDRADKLLAGAVDASLFKFRIDLDD